MMLWLGMAWAATTAEVPSDAYPTVQSACDDQAIELILVGPDAEPGGSCWIYRDLTIQAVDSSARATIPILSVSQSKVLVEGPLQIVEQDSGEGLLIDGGQVQLNDLLLDGGDRGGFYGIRMTGGTLEATELQMVGFYSGLYLQGEGTVATVQGGSFSDMGVAVSNIATSLGSDLRIEGVDFLANDSGVTLQAGGAILSDCHFEGHTDTTLSHGSGAGLTLENVSVVDNKGTILSSQHELVIEGGFFCGNSANQAVISAGSSLRLENVAFVGNGQAAVKADGQQVEVTHLSLVDDAEGIKMQGGSLKIQDSLLWEANPLALNAVTVSGNHNAYQARPPALGEGEGDLEIDDPGFYEAFDSSSCDVPPWLGEGSPLLGMASDGEAIGAYGLWSEEGDTGVEGGSSGTSWFSGGCGGGLPAAGLVLILPLLGLRRRP